jgi:hypothetical protein
LRRDQIAADRRVVGIDCAIPFVSNESPDADDPHDHSVAEALPRRDPAQVEPM